VTCADVRNVMWQFAGLDAARAEARFSRELAHLRTCASCHERFAAISLTAEEDAAGVYGPPVYAPIAKASIAAEPIRLSLSGGSAVTIPVDSAMNLEVRLDHVSAMIFVRVASAAAKTCLISLRVRDTATAPVTGTSVEHANQQVPAGEWAPLSRIGAGRYDLVIQQSPSSESYEIALDIAV
jgi:hypothetical protein